MLNWLKNKEIEQVAFDISGWNLREKNSELKIWDNNAGDILSINFFNKPPDIPVSLSQITDLRNFYRNLATDAGGGIIKIDSIDLKNLAAVECIFKIPMKPSGMIYVGSFTIPFRDKSYVVKLQCPERGVTGIRDTVVFDSFMASIEDSEDFDPFKGWAKDPYDETVTTGALMNLSEDEKYDEKFPEHPLSRLRKYLRQIEETISFDKQLYKLEAFT